MSRTAKQLSTREAKFVEAYARYPNGAKAARAAGYASHNAPFRARDLLRKRHIAQAVQRVRKEQARKLDVQQERVVSGLLGAVAEAQRQRKPALEILGWREIGLLLGYYPSDKKLPGLNRDLRRAARDWKGIRAQDLFAMLDVEVAEGDSALGDERIVADEV
jgi:hypothetical protein